MSKRAMLAVLAGLVISSPASAQRVANIPDVLTVAPYNNVFGEREWKPLPECWMNQQGGHYGFPVCGDDPADEWGRTAGSFVPGDIPVPRDFVEAVRICWQYGEHINDWSVFPEHFPQGFERCADVGAAYRRYQEQIREGERMRHEEYLRLEESKVNSYVARTTGR